MNFGSNYVSIAVMARTLSMNHPTLLAGLFTLEFLTCVGCAPPATGTFTPMGYRSTDYDYQVAAFQNGQLLPTTWQLDNYYLSTGKTLEPKKVDSYVTELELDLDGDGSYETKSKQFAYDLRFKNLVHDGVIFVRTIPISTDLEHKKLESLMDRYVEQIAGAGYEVVSLSSTSPIVLEKRYAAVVIDRVFAKLAGLEAYVVTLEVANLDQLKLDPSARKERVQLVLLHTNFRYIAKNKTLDTTRAFPVVMFAGYANQPRDFAVGLPDFHGLLSRIYINNQTGFSFPPPANVAATPSNTTSAAPESVSAPQSKNAREPGPSGS